MNIINPPPAIDPQAMQQLLAIARVIPSLQPTLSPAPVTADVVITVETFRDVCNPASWDKSGPGGMLTRYRLHMPVQYAPRVYLKASGLKALANQDVIRISAAGAVLRVILRTSDERDVLPPEASDSYHPVGIAFARVEQAFQPRAVLISTILQPSTSPFSDLQITPSMIQFRVTPLHGQVGADGVWASHITYKFWIFVQRARDGAIGIIDPYEEIENPP